MLTRAGQKLGRIAGRYRTVRLISHRAHMSPRVMSMSTSSSDPKVTMSELKEEEMKARAELLVGEKRLDQLIWSTRMQYATGMVIGACAVGGLVHGEPSMTAFALGGALGQSFIDMYQASQMFFSEPYRKGKAYRQLLKSQRKMYEMEKDKDETAPK